MDNREDGAARSDLREKLLIWISHRLRFRPSVLTPRGIALIGLVLASALPAAADSYLSGRVLFVADGDSLVLDVAGARHDIDLAGIDAPEANQPWGQVAAEQLRRLTGAHVVAEIVHRDSASKSTARLVYRKRDVASDLLSDGLAWSTVAPPAPGAMPAPYVLAEQQARAARRGLWSDEEQVPPWQWRTRLPVQ
jgi:micrococcal nuclease